RGRRGGAAEAGAPRLDAAGDQGGADGNRQGSRQRSAAPGSGGRDHRCGSRAEAGGHGRSRQPQLQGGSPEAREGKRQGERKERRGGRPPSDPEEHDRFQPGVPDFGRQQKRAGEQEDLAGPTRKDRPVHRHAADEGETGGSGRPGLYRDPGQRRQVDPDSLPFPGEITFDRGLAVHKKGDSLLRRRLFSFGNPLYLLSWSRGVVFAGSGFSPLKVWSMIPPPRQTSPS